MFYLECILLYNIIKTATLKATTKKLATGVNCSFGLGVLDGQRYQRKICGQYLIRLYCFDICKLYAGIV